MSKWVTMHGAACRDATNSRWLPVIGKRQYGALPLIDASPIDERRGIQQRHVLFRTRWLRTGDILYVDGGAHFGRW